MVISHLTSIKPNLRGEAGVQNTELCGWDGITALWELEIQPTLIYWGWGEARGDGCVLPQHGFLDARFPAPIIFHHSPEPRPAQRLAHSLCPCQRANILISSLAGFSSLDLCHRS